MEPSKPTAEMSEARDLWVTLTGATPSQTHVEMTVVWMRRRDAARDQEIAARASAEVSTLKDALGRCRVALNLAESAITCAILDDDGLDGQHGLEVLGHISAAIASIPAAEVRAREPRPGEIDAEMARQERENCGPCLSGRNCQRHAPPTKTTDEKS